MNRYPIPESSYVVDPETGCWNYSKALNGDGRPAAATFGMPMFRAICWMRHGPPPSAEYHAAHVCHNRRCINPEHSEWQHPNVNNPRIHELRETLLINNVSVRIKRRKTNKGDGRILNGWCAAFWYKNKAYKSGAYYHPEGAERWAENKLNALMGIDSRAPAC